METGSVLVVDDDPKILELVRAYLQRAGYAVVTAVDGEDALRKIAAIDLPGPPNQRFDYLRLDAAGGS